MKKVLLGGLALLAISLGYAQQKEGRVTYQRSTQMQISINDGPGTEHSMPRTRIDKFELNFANGQMSWKSLDDDIQDESINSGGGNVMIRTIGGGADDVTFCDFNTGRKVETREFFDKKFLIIDSLRRNNWKLTEETKTILGHLCRKATSQRVAKRMTMSMDNGKMERKEVDDTSTIAAWFTTDIPIAAGPEVQGQLPGLILELESNHGRSVYTALSIDSKPDLSAIKEPTKGKKVTQEEFAAERNKMMDEMQKNNRGGNMQIRVN